MSNTAISMKLGDRKLFPYFYRTSVSGYSFNPARIAFLKHYSWRKFAIINYDTEFFTSVRLKDYNN